MEPEGPGQIPNGDDAGLDDTVMNDTVMNDGVLNDTMLGTSYLRAMSSPPPPERAAEAIAVAMDEYDRLAQSHGASAARVSSILVRRWRPMAAAAAALLVLGAGSIVVLSDRKGSDQLSFEASPIATTRAAAPAPDTAEDAESGGSTESGAVESGTEIQTDVSDEDQIAAFAENTEAIEATAPESAAAPESAESTESAESDADTAAPTIDVPRDPGAPALGTPDDLAQYARTYAGHSDTIEGPSCAPADSTMLGHARYRGIDVAVMRLADERVAAIDLDDCEIIAVTE